MNFLAPEMLLGLLLVPIAIGFYLWAQRRRSKYAVRFTNLALLSNLAPKRPSWRRHLPPVLYLARHLGAAHRARPADDDRPGPARGRHGHPDHGRVGLDARDRRLADPSRRRPGVRPVVHRPAARERPRRHRRLRLRAGHARQPDHRPRPAQVGHRQPDRARRDGHGRRAHAGPRHRREDPEGRRSRDPRRDSVAPATASPAPAASGAPKLPTDQPSNQPLVAAILLSDGANSVGQTEPLDAAARAKTLGVPIYTIALGTPNGTVDVRDDQGQMHTLDVPPDTETLQQIASTTGGQSFTAPTAEDLKSVYANLQSRIGYTEERQEVTFALVAAGLLLVVVGAGLSAVWFGRLP